MKKLLLLVFLIASGLCSHATHIVGGYVSYKYLQDSTYELTVTIYRDCSSGTGFDNPVILGLFDASNSAFLGTYSLSSPVITKIDPPLTNPCLQVVTTVCVEQGIYTANIILPSSTKNYIIAHQRCCRNGSISNITTPGDIGETFSAFLPATVPYQNSNPTFNNYPPVYICLNSPLIYNHSATDLDGDELRYSLCAPYRGGGPGSIFSGTTCYTCVTPNPPSPPPYTPVAYRAGYSANNALGGSDPLTIDSITGVLTGIPRSIGQFVVGICVSEYRNGQLIGTYLRDFQFNVTQCNAPLASIPVGNIDPGTGIGVYTSNCSNFNINFKNNSYNPPPTSTPLNYQWDFGVPGVTDDTANVTSPNYTYPDTGTFLVRLIINKGGGSFAICSDTTYAFVRIYPTMDANFNLKDTCLGTPAVFADASTNAYGTINGWSWNFGDGITSTLQNPTHVYATKGNFNVTLVTSNSLGCKDTVQKTINLYTTAEGNFTVGTICTGAPAGFTTTMGGGYQWRFGNGQSSNAQNPTSTYNAPGNYTVSLISRTANGCIDSVAKIVTVLPGPAIITSNDTTICPAGSVQLNASGGTAYEWTPATGLTAPLTPNPVATPGTAGTTPVYYKVKVTDQNQCVSFDSVKISFFTPPNIGAGPDTSFCLAGGTDSNRVQLFAGGGVSYRWTPATGLNNVNISNPVSTLPASQFVTYVVEVTDQNNCITRDSASISSFPISITAGPDTAFCFAAVSDSNRVQLVATGGQDYTWSPATWLSANNIANPVATIPSNLTMTYVVQVINDKQCIDRDTVTIAFHPLMPVNAGADTLYCKGALGNNGVQLNATGSESYVWTGAGLSATNIPNPVATPQSTTTYTVVGTDSFGCISSDSLTITVQNLPVTSLTNDTTVCNQNVQLNATGGTIYTWQPADSLSCTNCASPVANPSATTTYYVQIKDGTTGCVVNDSVTISVSGVFVNALFTDSTVMKGDSLMLAIEVTGNGDYNYVWSPADYLNNANIGNPVSTPQADILYTVTVSNGPCVDTASIQIRVFVGDVTVKVPSGFTPNGDQSNATFAPVILNNQGTVKEFRIYNRYGQLIHNSTEPWDGKFKGADQPVGIYVYYIVVGVPDKDDMNLQGSVTLIR